MKPENNDLPKLAAPAQRALQSAGITRLNQLTKITESELGQLHGMGPNALGKLREALTAQGLAFKPGVAGAAPNKKQASPVSRTDKVDEFMKALDHPFKAEVQVVRDIIKGVNTDITEEIKWKAPSFSYKGEYMVTFNLWETKRIHLVFHGPVINRVKSKWLEGDYQDRRMMYFANMNDVAGRKAALEKIIKQCIKLLEPIVQTLEV